MTLWESVTLAVALGTDAFSIAIVCGIQEFANKNILKISGVIALFHIFMPMIGIFGGRFIEDILLQLFKIAGNIDSILNLIASGLLMIIGFYMIVERWLTTEENLANFNVQGWGLILLAFSVSVDSLSVGISLGMLGNINLIITIFIGVIAGIMMAAGLYFGSCLSRFLGGKAQLIGGLALIFLAFHIAGLL